VSAAAATADGFLPSRRQPAFVESFALSAIVHVALLAVLVLGVRFQSSVPQSVMVELWEPPPPPPAPVVEVKPAPPPPKVEPEPEVRKPPEIAEVQKPKPKPKPKPEVKKPEPPKRDPAFEKRMREQVALEQKKLAQERSERELREMIARQQAEARTRALAQWTDKIRGKIRGNIILPREIEGNPEAIFDVTLLPTGEVLTARKRKSSGNAAYDDAVERAIMKSSPLPKPDDAALFQRQLELKFRPQDR
jgi:colicin import membrane protein